MNEVDKWERWAERMEGERMANVIKRADEVEDEFLDEVRGSNLSPRNG